jgi:hypothetical protein
VRADNPMDIQNCNVVFRCPKTWNALLQTEDERVRYCSVCDRGVHLCSSQEELQHANDQGWCVALAIDDHSAAPRRWKAMDDDVQTFIVGDIRADYFIK